MTIKELIRRALPSNVRPRRIVRGPLRGYRLTTSWHDYPAGITGRAEPELLSWFASAVHPGETWLDVGAHYGYTSLALCRSVGETGRVFAFEALLRTAGHLATTRSVNGLRQLTVVPLALGDNPDISMVDVATWKGMAQPVSLPSPYRADGSPSEPIYQVSLDSIWPALCGADGPISGAKIDVEGMEVAVLRGMRALLCMYRPKLIIEVHHSRGIHVDNLATILEEAGYDPDGLPLEPPDREDRNYEFRPLTSVQIATGTRLPCAARA